MDSRQQPADDERPTDQAWLVDRYRLVVVAFNHLVQVENSLMTRFVEIVVAIVVVVVVVVVVVEGLRPTRHIVGLSGDDLHSQLLDWCEDL